MKRPLHLLLYILLAIAAFSFQGCEEDSDATISNGLPTSFPLEVGNVWSYETTLFDPIARTDSTYLDTLMITEKWEDFFLFKWATSSTSSLLMNADSLLLNFGSMGADTTLLENPYIWAFYNDVGTIDQANYSEYEFEGLSSVIVTRLAEQEFLDESWDTFKIEKHFQAAGLDFYEILYYNTLGIARILILRADGVMVVKTDILQVLQSVISSTSDGPPGNSPDQLNGLFGSTAILNHLAKTSHTINQQK